MASKVSGLIEQIQPGGSSGTKYAIASTAYGVCESIAGDNPKIVEITGFKLIDGVTIHVKFTANNSASNPTLQIKYGTGANDKTANIPIVQYGDTAAGTAEETDGWYAGAILTLTYDGTSWVRDQGFNTNDIPNSILKWQTTTAASTELYDFGVYVNQNHAASSSMNGGNYFNILNVPYRKASDNTKADWGWQLGNTTSNDGRLWYRTAGDNVWGDWQVIAHAKQSSANIGSATQPVYMTAQGVITAGTALKALAYKDNLVASDIPDISETYATNELVDGLLAAADAMIFKGTIGTDGTITAVPDGTSGKTYQAGYTYKVITAGKYANIQCEVGDLLIAISDSTSGQTTVNNAHWTVAQTNIDGAVTGPESSTGNNIATFSGTTGRIIQDSEKAFSTATPSSSSTDAQIPTAKAVWAAINALDGNLNSTTPGAGKTLTAFSQTNGKVSATFGNISITKSQVSDFAHAHGNLTNDGKIGSTANYAVYTTTSGKLTAGSLAVTDPNASGTATAFISTISQNSKGQITATKANLPALDTVKQSPAPTSNNDEYPILLKTTANANEETGTIKFSEPTITPKTGRLSATSFMVDSHVTLQWNSTDSSLDFIFA